MERGGAMSTALAEVDVERINNEARELLNNANEVVIASEADYKIAADFGKAIRKYEKQVSEAFDPIVKSTHAAWKSATAQKAKYAEPAKEAKKIIGSKMAEWDEEQRKIAEEEAKRKEAELKKQMEAERQRAIEEAKEQGDDEVAEQIAQEPVFVPPVPVAPSKPKVSGVAARSMWKFQVVDPNKVPREFLKIDESKIGQHVRIHKASTNIPGVRIWEEKSVAFRG